MVRIQIGVDNGDAEENRRKPRQPPREHYGRTRYMHPCLAARTQGSIAGNRTPGCPRQCSEPTVAPELLARADGVIEVRGVEN